jgi:ligand-binding SRPBCC domain-containing protein
MHLFETQVTLGCSLDEAFEFFLRPANALKISPPGLGLHFVSAPEVLAVGSRIEFKVQGWGQIQSLIHEITHIDRPNQYVEKQVKGPFKQWVHSHGFAADEAGHVVVTDRIEFDPPGGIIGLLISKNKILEHLEDGFDHRHMQLLKLFGV